MTHLTYRASYCAELVTDQAQQEGFEIPAEVEGEGELVEEETF